MKDLDLSAGEVRICRAYDERKKVVKAPKTEEGIRHVTVPPTLLPLLERIARDGRPEDRVAPVVAATEEYFRAGLFRSYVRAASVDRADLYIETPTLMIDFRSSRASAERSSSARLATTRSHRGGRFGEPFPALPAELVSPPQTSVPSVTGPTAGPLDG